MLLGMPVVLIIWLEELKSYRAHLCSKVTDPSDLWEEGRSRNPAEAGSLQPLWAGWWQEATDGPHGQSIGLSTDFIISWFQDILAWSLWEGQSWCFSSSGNTCIQHWPLVTLQQLLVTLWFPWKWNTMVFFRTSSLVSQKNTSPLCHFHLESINPCRATVSQLMPPWLSLRSKANNLAVAIFKPVFWRSLFWMLPFSDGHGVNLCSCSLWLLSMFPQSWGSAVIFLTAVFFSLSHGAGACSLCPARGGNACPSPVVFVAQSPQRRLKPGRQVTWPQAGWGAQRGSSQSVATTRETCLSALYSDLGSSPEIHCTSGLNHFTEVGRKEEYWLFINWYLF